MNPYETLPQEAFWSPAVARKHMLDIGGLWKAPFPITPRARIATYGSCFAQHFSKALVARGYTVHALDMVTDPARIWPRTAVPETLRFLANASYLVSKRLYVCRHVDAAYRHRVRAMLAEAGVDVIAQPAATIAGGGTTALSFDHPDPQDDHHANEAYGKPALEEIGAYADRLD